MRFAAKQINVTAICAMLWLVSYFRIFTFINTNSKFDGFILDCPKNVFSATMPEFNLTIHLTTDLVNTSRIIRVSER